MNGTVNTVSQAYLAFDLVFTLRALHANRLARVSHSMPALLSILHPMNVFSFPKNRSKFGQISQKRIFCFALHIFSPLMIMCAKQLRNIDYDAHCTYNRVHSYSTFQASKKSFRITTHIYVGNIFIPRRLKTQLRKKTCMSTRHC